MSFTIDHVSLNLKDYEFKPNLFIITDIEDIPEIRRNILNSPIKHEEEIFSWFDKLPDVFKDNVFKILDKKSLIEFAKAYPNYRSTCSNPIYWRTLNNFFDNEFVILEEMQNLVQYLNVHVKSIAFDLTKCKEITDYDILYQELFKNLVNLKSLDITHQGPNNIVPQICGFLN